MNVSLEEAFAAIQENAKQDDGTYRVASKLIEFDRELAMNLFCDLGNELDMRTDSWYDSMC